MRRLALLIGAVGAWVVACGSDDVPTTPASPGPAVGTSSGGAGAAGGATASVGGAGGTGGAGGDACHGTAAAADRERFVVVAHPFDADGPATDYEVLSLSETGQLAASATPRFAMGRASEGEIVFTPDGAIGISVHEDGTLGAFRIDEQGAVEVVHASFSASFYAGRVHMGPDGSFAWVLDANFPENGGGIYRVAIACDGTLTDEGLVTPTKLARRMAPFDGGFVLAADELLDAPTGADVHRLSLLPAPARAESGTAFSNEDAIVASLATTHDGKHVLVGDNSAFSSDPNGVAVLTADGLGLVQTLAPIDDPASIVSSPFDDRAVVVSGFGDAIVELSYDPSVAAAPFAIAGEVAYAGASPQLPVDAVTLARGQLTDRVFVAELSGVRVLRFRDGMPVLDEGLFDLGPGNENIVGAIGVQP